MTRPRASSERLREAKCVSRAPVLRPLGEMERYLVTRDCWRHASVRERVEVRGADAEP